MSGSERYTIPAQETRAETHVLNSRFIATIAPAFTVEQARAYVSHIRAEFPDAAHHVSAYLIGHGSLVVAHCHDDGEPSGTAGRPALSALGASGLGDAVVVVVRYFGGTKLGTGGLVRAYGDAVRAALGILPRATRISTHDVLLAVPYPIFERVRMAIAKHQGEVLEQTFAEAIKISVRLPVEQFAPFRDTLHELSNGTVDAVVESTNHATIWPFKATTT
jgi:uncharacterized YigZ family protein